MHDRMRVVGPFTALSAAGGVRPDVYVGWGGAMHDCWLSGSFTGLLRRWRSLDGAAGTHAEDARKESVRLSQRYAVRGYVNTTSANVGQVGNLPELRQVTNLPHMP